LDRTRSVTPLRVSDPDAAARQQTVLAIVDCQAVAAIHDTIAHDHLFELHDCASPADELGLAA
jgi:hypothetical protein